MLVVTLDRFYGTFSLSFKTMQTMILELVGTQLLQNARRLRHLINKR
jgi:hypothetical protein